jgi:hypothetical protein
MEQVEILSSNAHDGGTIQEFYLSKEDDEEQEVKLIVRLLRQIIEDFLADPRFFLLEDPRRVANSGVC